MWICIAPSRDHTSKALRSVESFSVRVLIYILKFYIFISSSFYVLELFV